ncbi:DUF11 domain-containing protein [Williamsia deligens]|uniref:DUF11 domain-containing protein n=1 Tax=Williamsia deligens TaxID=321325 RepID=A0ABW3GAK8_9NOCA|nr:DUF11 domain-containing protein [Williamsia deligens]MCP2196008.1 hypothetical protein [Williamsia deligens]
MHSTARALAFATAAAAAVATSAGVAAAAPTGSAGGVGADLVAVSNKVSFSCGLNVTNNGPETARSVAVYAPPFGLRSLGDIAPGQTKSSLQICFRNDGAPKFEYAVSTTFDPDYGNNGAQVNPPL